MKVVRVETTSVGAIADGVFDLAYPSGEASPVVLVVGPRASGKSTFLRAIVAGKEAIMPYGSTGELREVVRAGAPSAKIHIDWALTDGEREFGGLPESIATSEAVLGASSSAGGDADPGLMALLGRFEPTQAKVVYLPALRLPVPSAGIVSDYYQEQRLLAATGDVAKIGGALRAMRRNAIDGGEGGEGGEAGKAGKAGKRWASFVALVQRMCPELRPAGPSPDGQIEHALAGGTRLPTDRLATSQQHAVALASFVVGLDLGSSVVLLDSPEAGLPTGLAARWLEALREAEPAAQWIVATSDASLRDVPGARTVELRSLHG